MTRLEQIEQLRNKANVTYAEAKHVLEAEDGDLLEALIALERQGKVTSLPSNNQMDGEAAESTTADVSGETFSGLLRRIGRCCAKLINKGNAASLEVLKGETCRAQLPLTVVALLLIFVPWVTLTLIIVGIVLGYSYRFDGFELGLAKE